MTLSSYISMWYVEQGSFSLLVLLSFRMHRYVYIYYIVPPQKLETTRGQNLRRVYIVLLVSNPLQHYLCSWQWYGTEYKLVRSRGIFKIWKAQYTWKKHTYPLFSLTNLIKDIF